MAHGKYVGPIARLKGKTAILVYGKRGFYRAQFDDLKSLPNDLTHGWREYKKGNFKTWASNLAF